MPKKFKKSCQVSKQILFCSKQPNKYLKICSSNTICICFWISFKAKYLSENEISRFSQKSLTPDMQKNSKNGMSFEKIYHFARIQPKIVLK